MSGTGRNRHGVLKREPAEKVSGPANAGQSARCLSQHTADEFARFSERPGSGSLKNAAVDFLLTFSSRKK
jgi:hypothetical protein